jgi:ribA/ribD-fused uncharacterized protein
MNDIFVDVLTIDRFDDKYRFLSNFFDSEVELNGETYPTVEHAYQAAKTFVKEEIDQIRKAPTAGKAKRLGQIVTLRADWYDVSLSTMEMLVRQKFQKEPLRSALIKTYPSQLIEGNNWGDTFWGTCNGVGHNHLGIILMKIRDGLR